MPSAVTRKPSSAARGDGFAAEPSELRIQNWLTLGALVLGPILLFLLYYKLVFPGLLNPDALDFAQLGRNLSVGKGFTTFILRPALLTHGSSPLREPDVVHSPLYPILLGLAFGSPLGVKDQVVAGVSGLFYLLTIPTAFLLGSRLFSRGVGLAAAAILAFNAQLLEYGISGLHITLYIFLTTSLLLVFYGLASMEDGPGAARTPLPKGRYALTGALAAALYLTDPVFFWVIPLMAGAVLWVGGTRRLQGLVWFALPVLVMALPWMCRNAVLTGNPVFGGRGLDLWTNTASYPDTSAYRTVPTDLVPGVGLFKDVVVKMLTGVYTVLNGLPQISAIWVLAFFLPGLLFRFTDQAANRVRTVMLGIFATLLLSAMLFQVQMPLFVAVVPTMLIFAVACLVYLMQQAQLPRGSMVLASGLLGLVSVYPVIGDVAFGTRPGRVIAADSARALSGQAGRDDVVLSDQPWVVAWYGSRPSLWIPARDERIKTLRSQYPSTRWLFLTNQVRGYSAEWAYLYDRLLQWNIETTQARATKLALEAAKDPKAASIPIPGPLMIQGDDAVLFSSLSGFTTVGPAAQTDMNTVIAAVAAPSPKVGMGSGTQGQPSP